MTPAKRKEKHPLDEFKIQIESIQDGVRLIRESGISDDALYVLIQRASPTFGGYNKKKPTIGMIKAVMSGMDGLKDFVFPEEEEDDE